MPGASRSPMSPRAGGIECPSDKKVQRPEFERSLLTQPVNRTPTVLVCLKQPHPASLKATSSRLYPEVPPLTSTTVQSRIDPHLAKQCIFLTPQALQELYNTTLKHASSFLFFHVQTQGMLTRSASRPNKTPAILTMGFHYAKCRVKSNKQASTPIRRSCPTPIDYADKLHKLNAVSHARQQTKQK